MPLALSGLQCPLRHLCPRASVMKAVQAQRLKRTLVNRHRRIEFEELMRYQREQNERSEEALKKLSKLPEEMGEVL